MARAHILLKGSQPWLLHRSRILNARQLTNGSSRARPSRSTLTSFRQSSRTARIVTLWNAPDHSAGAALQHTPPSCSKHGGGLHRNDRHAHCLVTDEVQAWRRFATSLQFAVFKSCSGSWMLGSGNGHIITDSCILWNPELAGSINFISSRQLTLKPGLQLRLASTFKYDID